MARYPRNRILPIVLVIVIVIVAIAALVSITRAVFFSGNTPQRTETSDQAALTSTATGSSVRMMVRGPIVADEDFRAYDIAVSPTSRILASQTGYTGTQTLIVSLANNIPAYEEFVYALERANLDRGSEFSGERNDVRGICATGRLYQFEIIKNNQPEKTLWSTSCKGISGSLNARLNTLTALFISQIPDGVSLIRQIDV